MIFLFQDSEEVATQYKTKLPGPWSNKQSMGIFQIRTIKISQWTFSIICTPSSSPSPLPSQYLAGMGITWRRWRAVGGVRDRWGIGGGRVQSQHAV